MENRRSALTIILLLGIFSATVFAAGEPGAFLSWGAGARSLGMGGTFVGIADDVYASYFNSAGLAYLDWRELGIFQAALWEDTGYTFLAYAHPLLDKGCLGLNYVRLASGGAIRRNEYNESVGNFDNTNQAITLSYGRKIIENLSWGLTGKFINNQLDTFSSNNLALDTGLMLRLNQLITVGLNVQNLISQTFGDSDDKLPLVIKVGSGYRLIPDRLLLAFDFSGNSASNLMGNYSVGLEAKITSLISLRLGSNQQQFSAGFGLAYKKFNLDYALTSHYLGLSQRFSFNMKFGQSLTEIKTALQRQREAERLRSAGLLPSQATTPEEEQRQENFRQTYQQAIDDYRRGMYTIALNKFKLAQEIYPEDPDVNTYIERLNLVVPIVPQHISPGRTADLLRRGITYFVEGDGASAVKTIAYALSQEPDNFTIARLLSRFEEKTGIKAERGSAVGGLTVVDQKLYEALIAFRKKDYATVINLCEDILVLEPDNTTALKRLGSAFWSLGEKEKAISMWKKALELKPDAKLSEFLRSIGQ